MIVSHESQGLVQNTVCDFATREIFPFVKIWDESQFFPRDLFRRLGELGLMGMLVPNDYGGMGMGYREYVTAIIELAKVDPSIALSMAAHNSLCTNHITVFGSEVQKNKYLPLLASGAWLGSWALTEPNTGSDAANMQTIAVKDGGEWVINGSKIFITHGNSSDLLVLIARTGQKGDRHGATTFLIERSTPGLLQGKKQDKLGMRASETTEVLFQDCRISDSQRIGEVGDGFIQSLKILDGGRISIAALGVGTAQGAFEAALEYSKQREQFGQAISRFQGIAFKIADMYTDIEASKLLTYDAADRKDRGEKVTLQSSMAKYHSSETAVRVAGEAVQILGGYGFTKDFPVEKFFRDSKLCTIGEGTSEIQKLVISRELLKD